VTPESVRKAFAKLTGIGRWKMPNLTDWIGNCRQQADLAHQRAQDPLLSATREKYEEVAAEYEALADNLERTATRGPSPS
jgi:hypothetical protein